MLTPEQVERYRRDGLHVIEANSHYPPDNWLRRGLEMPLRGFESER
jgi:hypothetical protein